MSMTARQALRLAILIALLTALEALDYVELEDGSCAGPPEALHLLQQELLVSRGAAAAPAARDPLALPEPALAAKPGQAFAEHRGSRGFVSARRPPSTPSGQPMPTGLTYNAVGDLQSFIHTSILYYGASIGFVIAFCILRLRYPIIYAYFATQEGKVPTKPTDSFFGWYGPAMAVTTSQVASCVTLDHALLLEFARLGMRISAAVGVPMVAITGTLNWVCGGHAAGQDRLSYMSFGNVVNGSWLYWLHSFVVWAVVIYVTWEIHESMRLFLPRRVKWLQEMSEVRANTVLVEGIPVEHRSEQRVKEKFEDLVPGCTVRRVSSIKDTSALVPLVFEQKKALEALRAAEATLTKDPDATPMVRESVMGARVEAIPYWRRRVEELEPRARRERQRILAESKSVGPVNMSTAFVTFEDRVHAEIALRLSGGFTFRSQEWEVLKGPEPTDVLWQDLSQDDTAREVRTLVGYLLVALLYFLYLPMILLVTNLGKEIDLTDIGLGVLQPLWEGVAPTLGLTFMCDFLPTFLALIFKTFFTVRCEVMEQHKLQVWYFWFQFVFVILATAVGQNFRKFILTLVLSPRHIVAVLADTMPYATHYYMSYLVLQCMTHSMNLTRYMPFFKYKAALALYEEKEAKVLAEPEDQDYYGIGSRSARWLIMLGINIVFGTLCPPLNLICWVNFLCCHTVYSYLIVFAENRKSDSGGCFFVTNLELLFPLLVVYVVMMAGVLWRRAASVGPCCIAAASLVWLLFSLCRFKDYGWEKLPLEEMRASTDAKRRPDQGQYVQPEMLDG